MTVDPALRADVSEETRSAAGRLGALPLALEVVGVSDVAPAMRRITLRDPFLGAVEHRAGQDLTFTLPGDRPIHRRYTIRRLDRERALADIEVVRHGDGPGARWAATVRPGDRVEAVGPRGKIFVAGHASHHVFVGDETYLPAASAMIESLAAPATAALVIECDEPLGALPLGTAAGVADPVWVIRDPAGAAVDVGAGLIAGLGSVDLGAPGTHVYIGGEAHAVNAVKAAVLEAGVPAGEVDAKPYWRADLANADHGEPPRD